MAFLGLRVPHEAARLLSQAVEHLDLGDPEPLDQYHVTLVYFDAGVSIEDVAAAIGPIFDVTSTTKPFAVSTTHVSDFGLANDSVPIIALLDAPELHALHARIGSALDEAGIPFSKKWREYRPHVTLTYARDPYVAGKVSLHLPAPITWGAHELVLWAGNSGDDRLVVTFPFDLGLPNKHEDEMPQKTKTAKLATIYRGAVRLASTSGSPRR